MNCEKGYALLDVIVATLILSVALGSLTAASTGGRKALLESAWKTKAINQAQNELERIRVQGLTQAINNGLVDPGYTVEKSPESGITLKINSDWVSDSPNLLRIEVRSSWSRGPETGTVSLITLLTGT
ncbi:MAG TPA: hypothetical protein VHQ46_00895 [Desulfobacteria bacterium]|nr:hypothetical protein [Desulfobacteria bacterium]